MTTTATNALNSAVANGVTPVPFTFQARSAVEVGVQRAGIEQNYGTDYTVTLNPDGTGSITPIVSWGADSVIVYSKPDYSQQSNFARFAAFYPDQLVTPLDALARTVIALKARTPLLPVGAAATAAARAGKFISFDANGDVVMASGSGADSGLRIDLAAPGGSALSSFIGAGAGATARTVQDKLRDWTSILDYGATAAVAAAGIIAAINSTPALGGRIGIPSGSWALASDPSTAIGTKSVFLDIAPDAIFTGAGSGEGKFAYMKTNTAQLAIGPYWLFQSHQKSTNANGGTAGVNIEMIQPSDYGAGQSVALYAGAQISCANAAANGWAANFLGVAQSTALGVMTVLEIDANNFSASAKVKGLAISGAGTQNAFTGIEISRLAMAWGIGISLANSVDAIIITPNANGRGIAIHSPTANVQGVANAAFSARQFANGSDTLLLQRFTDAAPTGNLLRAIDTVNGTNLAILSAIGDMTLAGGITTASLTVSTSVNAGIDALIVKNLSNAAVTTKFIGALFKGVDTVNTEKSAGELRFDPVDVNWANATATLSVRRGDAVSNGMILFGTGAPAIAAPVGAIYTRQDGGAATTLYVKESGTGTAGWVAK